MEEEKCLISRRDFLKISGTLAGVFAVATQLPEGLTLLKEVSAEEAEKLKAEAQQAKTYVRELGLLGWGMGCQLAAIDTKNNRITRIRPLHFDWQYKPEDFNYDAAKIEVNGKVFKVPLKSGLSYFASSYKKRIYSPNRVKYPLKRVDFDPRGARNPENRGKSGFVRISWDEAINMLVSEIKRISETYGPSAILIDSEGHSQTKTIHGGALGWLGHLNYVCKLGWTITIRNPDSWEGLYWGSKHVWGGEGLSAGGAPDNNGPNCYLDFMENGELLIWWGGDPETTRQKDMTQFSASKVWFWLTDAGKKQIWITPDLNYSACIHADRWIPILPATDVALGLAIAYVWITEGLYDKQYVETHTYGFEEFKKYVLGEEDGVPKTPKWAEQICGVPARTIKALARLWARKKTSVGGISPGIRGPYTTEFARVKAYLIAMQGLGKPGVQLVEFAPAIGLPVVAPTAAAGGPLIFMAAAPPEPGQPFLPKVLLRDAILNPPIEFYGTGAITAPVEDQFVKYKFPQEGFSEIHMIWKEPACYTVCWSKGFIDAVRSPKIEFVVIQHPWLEDDCYFADLVLPGTTPFEDDIDMVAGGAFGGTEFSYLSYQPKIIEPIGESRSDLEIIEMVAEKLGVRDKLTAWKTHEEAARIAFEKSGAQNYISWDEFKKKQYWIAPVNPKWKEIKPGMRWYWEMPEGKGIKTKSGKIEFYCQWLAEHFPNDPERPPVAHYIPYGETHQESLVHPRAKQYPFLIVSNHPRWRGHAMCDDVSWLREIPDNKIRGPDGYLYEVLWTHPVDAAKKGIKHGDIVMVYNDRGATLRAAYVTEGIIPGAVGVNHGARFDPISIEPLIDRGGSDNILCPLKPISKNTVGMTCSGFLVDVKKVDLEELKAKYPEAFKRKFHPDAGPCLEGWLKG